MLVVLLVSVSSPSKRAFSYPHRQFRAPLTSLSTRSELKSSKSYVSPRDRRVELLKYDVFVKRPLVRCPSSLSTVCWHSLSLVAWDWIRSSREVPALAK